MVMYKILIYHLFPFLTLPVYTGTRKRHTYILGSFSSVHFLPETFVSRTI